MWLNVGLEYKRLFRLKDNISTGNRLSVMFFRDKIEISMVEQYKFTPLYGSTKH